MNWIELPPANRLRGYDWRFIASEKIKATFRGCPALRDGFGLHILAGPQGGKISMPEIVNAISYRIETKALAPRHACQSIDAKWVPGLEGVRVLVLPTRIPTAAVRSGCAGDGEAVPAVSPDLEQVSPRLPVGAGT